MFIEEVKKIVRRNEFYVAAIIIFFEVFLIFIEYIWNTSLIIIYQDLFYLSNNSVLIFKFFLLKLNILLYLH